MKQGGISPSSQQEGAYMMRFFSIIVAVSVFLLSSGTGRADNNEFKTSTTNHTITVTFEKGRPVKGSNQVEIAVQDTKGSPVTGAQVVVDYLMPSLPGKPPMMAYSTEAKAWNGVYRATVDFGMKGEWKMVVRVSSGRYKVEATFTFTVR
jgi:hypothetical protein